MLCSANCLRLTRDRHWTISFPPSSSSTPTSTCHPPLFPRYMSHSSSSSLLPLLPLLAFGLLLLTRHFTDTPTETSDLISRQEVRGFKFPPVRVIPHISAYFIQEKGELLRSTGVWSPNACSFLTARPFSIILVIALKYWLRLKLFWKANNIS